MSASAILSLLSCVVALDQNKCLVDLNSGQIRLLAGNVTRPIGLNNEGESVSDTIATAISYRDCVKYCPGGSGQEPFNWSVFSTQFAAWLLPWLALISQLPYGASDRLDNLMSMVLTVGSPTLAAYSLILTSLNNYHLAFNFSQITFPNAGHAVRILSGLQQLPLQIDLDDGLLASLVVLPKNDTWWAAMDAIVGHENAWTISALAGIVWVVVAYALTVVDSFTGLAEKESLDSQLERHSGTSDGPGVGSMWLWLLPIVVGWLVLSPQRDPARLRESMKDANKLMAVVSRDGAVMSTDSVDSGIGSRRAIMCRRNESIVLHDEARSPPIFNYARFFSWTQSVDRLEEAFQAASDRAEEKMPVDMDSGWDSTDEPTQSIHPRNRKGTRGQIVDYCSPPEMNRVASRRSRQGPRVLSKMAVASFMALMLQWCTAGAAIIIVFYTPTTGLGCRSGAFVLYAVGSTVVWFLMVLSSIVARYSTTASVDSDYTHSIPMLSVSSTGPGIPTIVVNGKPSVYFTPQLAETLAIVLNKCGKVLASLNALWIVCTCTLQFANVFGRCICNSSVFGRGAENAFNVLKLAPGDVIGIRAAWVAGVCMTVLSAGLFLGFIWMHRRPPQTR